MNKYFLITAAILALAACSGEKPSAAERASSAAAEQVISHVETAKGKANAAAEAVKQSAEQAGKADQ